MEVAIADGHTISALNVYCECMLEIFSDKFPLDLIPILMRDVYVL